MIHILCWKKNYCEENFKNGSVICMYNRVCKIYIILEHIRVSSLLVFFNSIAAAVVSSKQYVFAFVIFLNQKFNNNSPTLYVIQGKISIFSTICFE